MSESRRVLAVDEQRATLEFLQSVLPLVEGQRFEITRAFSAEEGLLELRRQPYDLLISGLRLPGMDGLTLISRAKRLRPEMGAILATDRPPAELRQQAAAAGVDFLLHKPLDAEEFLAAVQSSLASVPLAAARRTQAYATEEPVALPSAVLRRLETLVDETGAGQVVLSTLAGEIVHVTGGQLHRDLPRLMAAASASVGRALELSGQLNEQEPRAVQFVEGITTDLYWANVGREYFVAILFDAQLRRGRLGTVWVFTQRAVSDLKRLLAEAAPARSGRSEPKRVARPAAKRARKESVREAKAPAPDSARPPAKEVNSQAVAPAPDLPDEWPVAGQSSAESGQPEKPVRSDDELALDTFWDEALATENGSEPSGSGISLAEAKARGLIAEDFNPDGWRDEAGG